jgi:hypothetical protein
MGHSRQKCFHRRWSYHRLVIAARSCIGFNAPFCFPLYFTSYSQVLVPFDLACVLDSLFAPQNSSLLCDINPELSDVIFNLAEVHTNIGHLTSSRRQGRLPVEKLERIFRAEQAMESWLKDASHQLLGALNIQQVSGKCLLTLSKSSLPDNMETKRVLEESRRWKSACLSGEVGDLSAQPPQERPQPDRHQQLFEIRECTTFKSLTASLQQIFATKQIHVRNMRLPLPHDDKLPFETFVQICSEAVGNDSALTFALHVLSLQQ